MTGLSLIQPETIKEARETIRVLGPITVAFFVILGFLMYLYLTFSQAVLAGQVAHGTQLDLIERMINEAATDSKDSGELDKYFLRQVCRNTATTEAELIACNPPPGQQAL